LKTTQRSANKLIKTVNDQIAVLEEQIFGRIVAATLLIDCPELAAAQPEQVCALAGLVPMNNASGRMRGQRRIKGGRTSVRCMMFTAAMAVIRTKAANVFKEFYERLTAKGKPKMLALTAAAHKRLRIAHYLLKRKVMWKNNP
jgi:transposase